MKMKYKDVRGQIEQEIELKARMLEDHTASEIRQRLIEDWISNKRYKWDGKAWREKPVDEKFDVKDQYFDQYHPKS